MDWITADTHAFHKNLTYGVSQWANKDECRLFDNEEDMTLQMAENINSVVLAQDRLICVGDWSFQGYENVTRFRDMINCRDIVFIYGNHDHNIQRHDELKKLFSYTGYMWEGKFGGKSIVACHYAMRIWNKSHHGVWQLYGHSHGSLPDDPNALSMDVGLDTFYESIPNHLRYYPYNPDEVSLHMKNKKLLHIDHHNQNTN